MEILTDLDPDLGIARAGAGRFARTILQTLVDTHTRKDSDAIPLRKIF